jgi:hypothetical protein
MFWGCVAEWLRECSLEKEKEPQKVLGSNPRQITFSEEIADLVE